MKIQKITIEIEGKTEKDLAAALEEVAREIKDGYLSGSNSNDSGSFSFEVNNEVRFIEADEVTEEAKHIATQFSAGDIDPRDLEQSLVEFAKSDGGLNLATFNEYIEGNMASMIQVMIDEFGGVDCRGDADVAEKLSAYFDFDPAITTLAKYS